MISPLFRSGSIRCWSGPTERARFVGVGRRRWFAWLHGFRLQRRHRIDEQPGQPPHRVDRGEIGEHRRPGGVLRERPRTRLLDVLQAEGFIRGYAEVETKGHKELEIELKYHEGEPVIRELKRVSTPGRRVYSSVSELKPHRQGLGVSILSTPKGVMSDSEARAANVGGEVLCRVF